MLNRQFSFLDKLIIHLDQSVRTLAGGNDLTSTRPSPAIQLSQNELTDTEKKLSAGLMRVNHTGEVCAQALYQGQSLTAKLPEVRQDMERAAAEEIDHLVWCQKRLNQLDSHPSLLNPIWYGLSFTIGAGAGLISDKISLGFVAATEDQVCNHLQKHLQELPVNDEQSRAVVTQMLEDEAKHAQMALNAGGKVFPAPVKNIMTLVSNLMTKTSFHI